MTDEKTTDTTWELQTVTPTALESLERANIDMQISTAKRYPRSLSVVKRRMLDLATLDQETAESCFYRLNRKGKMIEGPSIRLAEIAGSSFGNLRYGARVIGNDGKTITAQGYCHDLETNVMSQVEVQRRITDRDGNTYSEDMQVVTGNAACAIAARNAIFKVVPFAFVKPIFSAAKHAAVGDIKTLAERRTRMLKQFEAMGIDSKRICSTLEKGGIEEIGLEDLETLIGLYNAVKDGEQNIDQAFPVPHFEKPKFATPREAYEKLISKPEAPPEEPKRRRGRKPKSETESPAETKQAPEPPPKVREKLGELAGRLGLAKYTAEEFLQVAARNGWVPRGTKFEEISDHQLGIILENFDTVMKEMDKAFAEPPATKTTTDPLFL